MIATWICITCAIADWFDQAFARWWARHAIQHQIHELVGPDARRQFSVGEELEGKLARYRWLHIKLPFAAWKVQWYRGDRPEVFCRLEVLICWRYDSRIQPQPRLLTFWVPIDD